MTGDSSEPRGRRPLVGVLGGLGPAATLDFYAKLLDLTAATSDQEHVRLIIDADPDVPDRSLSVSGAGPSSAPALVAKAQRLEAAGVDLLVMACNTAHAYQAEIEAAVTVPFMSIVDEALKTARSLAPRASKVGILATSGTLAAGLYQVALKANGAQAVTLDPESLGRFMNLIYAVKGGQRGEAVRREMAQLAASLAGDGAEVLIAACTEVPLVLAPPDIAVLGVPLVDSTMALARAVLAAGS